MQPRVVGLLVLNTLLTVGLPAQSEPKSSARELYFSGLEEYQSSKAKPNPNSSAAPQAPKSSTGKRPKPTVTLVKSSQPLGIRYSLLKVRTDGGTDEVPSNSIFRTGDRIRLKIEVNDEGFLYLVARGTSGSWDVLFPRSTTASGSNRVLPGQPCFVPPEKGFSFRGQPGTEELFLVLSRQAERAIDDLLYDLHERRNPPPPSSKPGVPVLLAQNTVVENDLVERLRAATRDLVIEFEDESAETKPRGGKDHGVYVVNSKSDQNARVIVDIRLVHR